MSRRRPPPCRHRASTATWAAHLAAALGDANAALLQELTRKCRGDFAQARETEDLSTQLNILFSRIGRPSIDGLRFLADDAARTTAKRYAAYYSGFLRSNKGTSPDCKAG